MKVEIDLPDNLHHLEMEDALNVIMHRYLQSLDLTMRPWEEKPPFFGQAIITVVCDDHISPMVTSTMTNEVLSEVMKKMVESEPNTRSEGVPLHG